MGFAHIVANQARMEGGAARAGALVDAEAGLVTGGGFMFRLLGGVVLACVFCSSVALAAPKKKVAVAQVRVIQDVKEGTAAILTEIVTTELAVTPSLRVIGSAEIGALIGFEKEKLLLGCTAEDQACIAEIGGSLGVEYVLLAQVGVIGKLYRFSVILVDTKNALVAARAAVFSATEDELAGSAQYAAKSILAQLGLGPQPSLPGSKADVAMLPPPPLPPADSAPGGATPSGPAAPTGPAAAERAKSPAPGAGASATAAKPAGPDLKPVPATPAQKKLEVVEPSAPVGPRLLVATGIVSTVGGAVLAIFTSKAYRDLEDDRRSMSATDYDRVYPTRSNKIRKLALGSDVALGVGGALLISGTVWSALTPEPPKRLVPVTVAPAFGPGETSLVVTARW